MDPVYKVEPFLERQEACVRWVVWVDDEDEQGDKLDFGIVSGLLFEGRGGVESVCEYDVIE